MDASAEDLVQTIVTLVSTWGLRVIGALAVLIVGRVVAGSLRRMTRRASSASNPRARRAGLTSFAWDWHAEPTLV